LRPALPSHGFDHLKIFDRLPVIRSDDPYRYPRIDSSLRREPVPDASNLSYRGPPRVGGIDPLTKRRRNILETAPIYELAKKALTRYRARSTRTSTRSRTSPYTRPPSTGWRSWRRRTRPRAATRTSSASYILPTFGDLPAAKLNAELLERFYARCTAAVRCALGRPAMATVIRPTTATRSRSQTGVRSPFNLRRLSGLGGGVLGRLREWVTLSGYLSRRQGHVR
jgi:hypothetical protein